MNDHLAVVVSSCDGFADVLKPFSIAFNRYWSDCCYKKFLITESPLQTDFFNEIYAEGKGVSWCERLAAGLRKLSNEYVLFLLDDYLLCKPFSNDQAEQIINFMKQYAADHLRLVPFPKPERQINELIGEYIPGQVYRVSANAAIWKRESFIKMLELMGKNEAWMFEREGSFLKGIDQYTMLGVYRPMISYEELVIQGHWMPKGIQFCQKEHIVLQMNARKELSLFKRFLFMLRHIFYNINPTLMTKLAIKFLK